MIRPSVPHLPNLTSSHRRATVRISALAALCAVAVTAAGGDAGEAEAQAAGEPEVTRIGDGVYAVVRREPLGLAVNANSLVVVGDAGVIVVDAQFTRAATQQTITAIRRITPKPVTHVVNTHWHDDHLAGNQVYRDTFPGVRFVMHANTAADLVALGGPNRVGTVRNAPPLVERFDRLLGMGLGIDSTPANETQRASVGSAIRIMRQYLAEAPGFRDVAADDTVRTSLTLGSGAQRVEVRWFGAANTRGDLVVHVPAQGVVATGDLVVAPVPFAFGSHPAAWVDVMDSVAALRPRVVVPGHGPVMRDLAYVGRVRAMLAEVRDGAAAAAARGDSLPDALRAMPLAEHRAALAAGDPWTASLFDRFFRVPAVTAALAQARPRPDSAGGR